MSKQEKDLKYIGLMLENISNLKKDVKWLSSQGQNLSDERSLRLLSFSLEQIGEQVSRNRLSKEIQSKYQYSWGKVLGLRVMIAHNYGNVEPLQIINIIKNDIPQLEELLLKMENDLYKELYYDNEGEEVI